MKLSPRWAGTTQKERTDKMRALGKQRQALLSPRQKRALALRLVAARRKKHDQKNHTR